MFDRIAWQRAYREKYPERIREYARRRRVKHPGAASAAAKAYAARNPLQVASRGAVRHALESGLLVRGECEVHGTDCQHGPVCAHHENYHRKLDVRWLCRKAHAQVHAGMIVLAEREPVYTIDLERAWSRPPMDPEMLTARGKAGAA
ncbi:hypothetical protein LCGC14_2311930 [marine sediment metagenome]|uniref:Uncharacterized protein n=1 Tax=marine sediment metagenome TaxID=412755 RepID=A0A0F9D7Y7_9ZZZZ